MGKVSDEVLINDLLKNERSNRAALKIIYQRNYPKVSRMIFQKNGTEHDAKDIFQESMIVFYKMVQEEKFRGEAQIDTIIYAIARNLWYQKLRKERSHEDLSVIEDTKGSTEVNVNWDEFSKEKVIRSLIEELPADCQKLIKLFYYEKWTIESIQAEFGLKSIQASKNKKYKCMKELLNIFKTKNITPSSF